MHVVRFTEEGRYGQPKYSYKKGNIRCYEQLCSGFNFLLRMGLRYARFAGADALHVYHYHYRYHYHYFYFNLERLI